MRETLPKGWVQCNIGDVVGIQNGYAFKSTDFTTKGIPLVKQTNLIGDTVNLSKCQYLDKRFLKDKSNFIINKDEILIGTSGSLGKAAIYKYERPALQNQRTGKLVFYSDSLLSQSLFLHYFTNISYILEKSGKGCGVQNISVTEIENFEFTLPPLNEQKRIVAKLDAIIPRIDSLKARLDKISVLIKRFRQSVLTAAATGKLTETWREEHNLSSEWEEIELKSLIPKGGIFDGPFGSNLKTKDYTTSGVRVIRLENIAHLFFINEKKIYITKEKYQTLLRHTVGQGDMIFSSFISEEIRACIIPALPTKAIAKADCFCIRPDENKVEKRFLLYSLVSFNSYNQLVSNIHGATRPRINTTQLKRLTIPLPPPRRTKRNRPPGR